MAHSVFFAEGVLLLATGALMVAKPDTVLSLQGFDAPSPLANGNLQQFGVMCILMGYVGVFAPLIREVVKAALLCDVLWVYVFVRMTPAWTVGNVFGVGVTVFLACIRSLFLLASNVEVLENDRERKIK